MPNYGFDPGLGPHSLKDMPVVTVYSPADTNSTTNVVQAEAPLKWGREGSSGRGQTALRCADGDVPEMMSVERCQLPSYPIGVVLLPNAVANGEPMQSFVVELTYTGSVPASDDEIGVLANGAGAYKFAATGGLGRLLKVLSNNRALVEF